MDKLKPCPFCGVELEIDDESDYGDGLLIAHPDNDCFIRGTFFYAGSIDEQLWNRRANDETD